MEMHDVRNSLLKLLRADVMGPQLDAEERPIADESLQITGSPDRFYLVGKLLPVRRESSQGAAGSQGHDIIREDGHDADLSLLGCRSHSHGGQGSPDGICGGR